MAGEKTEKVLYRGVGDRGGRKEVVLESPSESREWVEDGIRGHREAGTYTNVRVQKHSVIETPWEDVADA